MRLLAITNLFPRPDKPTLGMYNLQLFTAMGLGAELRVACLVPEWRLWRYRAIRKWCAPDRVGMECGYWPVLYVPGIGRSLSWMTYGWSLGGLKEQVERAELIFAAWLYPDGVVAARLAKKAGTPCWLMVLGSDVFHLESPARREVILAACESAQGVICVAGHLKDRLMSAGVKAEKLHVVPNGVDTDLFRPRSKSEAWAELRAMRAEGARISSPLGGEAR